MRTGLVGEVDASEPEQTTTDMVVALMRVFMKDAIVVAGRYTLGHGRTTVRGEDMRGALMYCARTFFEDPDMYQKIAAEQVEMDEEDESDEDDESGEEEESGEDDESEEQEFKGDATDPRDVQLVKHVDAIVATWNKWVPEDPVHLLIKRAIDQTPV
jgi:Mg-chelatase subunit ChlI